MSFADAPRCTHITVTGHRCGSPALRKQDFCYFHTRMIKGVNHRVDMQIDPTALFESPDAIQATLMHLYSDILQGHIDYRKASLLLKALQIATTTLSRRVDFERARYNMVTEVPNWAQQSFDEHPEYGPPVTEVERVQEPAISSQLSAVSNEKAAVSNQHVAVGKSTATIDSSQSEIGNQKAAVSSQPSAISTEKAVVSNQHSAVGKSAATIDSSQSQINNQKSEMNPAQSSIANRQSKISLSPRQQAQWNDIQRVERALAGARKGNINDVKTVFAFAGLAPRKSR